MVEEGGEALSEMIEVHRSDLLKILDVLNTARRHHELRDEMNAALHLATHARWSPLTSELAANADRVRFLLTLSPRDGE